MRPTPISSRLWRWLLPVAVVACLYVNYVYNANPPAGALDNGAMSARHPTLLTPAGYAFGIWGVIFTGLVGYTIWQLLPRQRESALATALAAPLTLAVLATAAWTVVFSYGQIGLSLLVMLALLGLLTWSYARARPLVLAGTAPGWPTWFLSLYLGWILLATVLNVVFGLRDALGWQVSATQSADWCVLVVLAATVITVAVGRYARDPLLPLPVAWGLVGTWVAQHHAEPKIALASLSAVGALLLSALLNGLLLARRHRAVSQGVR